jgi:sugar lactone lactonase YvrE
VDVFLPTTHGVIVPSTTVDGQGNIYIADMGNNEVRKVDHATQNISTVAGNWSLGAGYNGDYIPATSAQLKYPAAVAVDTQGNLYIADSGNNRIRRVDHVTHIITTVAGTGTAGYYGDNGPAINARLNSPSGLAFDPSGNLYISDSGNDVIRKLTF